MVSKYFTKDTASYVSNALQAVLEMSSIMGWVNALENVPEICQIADNLSRSKADAMPHGIKLSPDRHIKVLVQSAIQSPFFHV